MKLPAVLIAILAILVGITPFFNNCRYAGGSGAAATCYWTARGELALSIPLMVLAGLLAFSWRKESRRAMTALGTVLGACVILLPTHLIGTCPGATALCNQVMKPALIFIGGLVIGTNLAALVISERHSEYGQHPLHARRPAAPGSRQAKASKRRTD